MGMGYFYATPIAERISMEASRATCIDHPDAPHHAGFGYAGGGFGPYRRCNVCHVVFAKRAARDGNESEALRQQA